MITFEIHYHDVERGMGYNRCSLDRLQGNIETLLEIGCVVDTIVVLNEEL